MNASKHETKFFKITSSRERELHKFNEADMAGRSMFVTFLDWRTQLIVFLVYGGIGCIVLLAGHEFQSFALFAVGGLINSVYVVFKLVPMLWRWFVGLVAMFLIMSCGNKELCDKQLPKNFKVVNYKNEYAVKAKEYGQWLFIVDRGLDYTGTGEIPWDVFSDSCSAKALAFKYIDQEIRINSFK